PKGAGLSSLSRFVHLSVKAELFLPLFLLLLPFYILPYHLLVQAHRANTVTLRPKVIAPISPLPQIPKRAEHPDCTLAFQAPHILRDCQLRRHLHYHKGVIRRTMTAERNLRPSFSVN